MRACSDVHFLLFCTRIVICHRNVKSILHWFAIAIVIIVVCCHHNEWFFARPKSYWSNFLLPSPSYCSTFFWIFSLAEVSSWILETFLFYFDKFSLMSVKKDQTFSSHKRLVNVSLSSYLKVVCLRILVKLWRNKEHSHQKAKQDRQWC